MSDPKPDACEVCGTGPVDIVLYPVAVHYKGSGFYSTDYGRGSRKAGKDTDTGAASSDGSAKTEQPTAKTDAKASDSKSSDSSS